MAMLPLPVDYDAIRRALVAAAAAGTGLPSGQVLMLQPEQPGAPRPPAPYVGILVTSPGVVSGWDWPVPVEDAVGQRTGLVEYTGLRSMGVSFETYGGTHEQAYGVMAALQASMMAPPVQQLLEAAGIAVETIGSVADLSALLNTSYEGRAQMDVSFCIASSMVLDAGLMDQATVSGTVTLDDNSTVTVDVAQIQEP